MDASQQPILTVPEICSRYSIDRHTVYDLIRRKKLVAFKIGKRWLRIVDPGPEGFAGLGHPDPERIMADTPVYRSAEAAYLLGVHKSRITQLIEKNKIKCTILPDGRRLFSLNNLLERVRVMAGEVTPKNPNSIRPWVVMYGRKWLDRKVEELRLAPAVEGLEVEIYPSLAAIRELAEQVAELPLTEEERELEWQKQSALLIKKVKIRRRLNT